MEKGDKSPCEFEGKSYMHGSGLCPEEKCMICDDGQWEETQGRFLPQDPILSSPNP